MLSGPVQLAYAVSDVRTAAAGWASVGAGPFFVIEHIELHDVRINGTAGTFDHSSAYGWWGVVMLELICQHEDGSGVEPIVGTAGLHHVAHFVDDLDAASKELTRDGHAEVLSARTSGGSGFAMHDGGAARGHLIEIYEPADRLLGFYDLVRDASVDWDGSDPVRSP